MARPLRIEYPGAFYHVTSRGNERKAVFKSKADREKFLDYLKSATQRYGASFHAWQLMGNHYHLLLETPEGNLSQIMRHINGAYTAYFNAKRSRSGHLFQGRYKAILVEADSYLLELSRYIHLNPVRARMVSKPEDYPWSSYPCYIGLKEPPQWLRRDFILSYFSGISGSRAEYKLFVEEKIDKDYPSPLDKTVASTILGGEGFVAGMVDEFLSKKEKNREMPAIKELRLKPDFQLLADAAGKAFKNDERTARQAAIYLNHRHSGAKLKQIGIFFGISESGVTQASRRFQNRIEVEMGLNEVVQKLTYELGLCNV